LPVDVAPKSQAGKRLLLLRERDSGMSDPQLIQYGKEAARRVSYSAAEQLFDDIKVFLSRFVVYPSPCELVAHVLWIAHAWFMDSWDSTPRFAFLSPEPASGKSRALEVTAGLVPRHVHAVNTSPAYLFRKVSDPEGRPTILYDEIDTVFGPKAKDNEDIRGMLNAGHRKGATAGRCVVRGKEVFTEELPAYCAVALAGLDDLPDTIMTRSVVVRMRRRASDEPIEPWRQRINEPQAKKLYERLQSWSAKVKPSWPTIPDEVTDRDADVWEALLAVADLAGDRWAADARVAAVTLVTASRRRPPTTGILLLRDLKKVFDRTSQDKMPTEEILSALAEMDESPWAVIRRGEPIDNRALSSRLKKYGIAPKPQRNGDNVFRGYARAQFEDAWKRYLEGLPEDDDDDDPPELADSSVTAVTAVTDPVTLVTDVTQSQGHTGAIANAAHLNGVDR
jgi:Protein of unknown function (DUF3631)